ncbi:MAG: exodeoxyribonuclease VII small subunit [Nanoarchaeota archaeon]|nr:exodeoxyribonuclease VII small subunit [Nanoarchaeota archaeon]
MPKKTASFEENLEELNEIVENLENGGSPLKKSLDEFQKGLDLIKQCSKELETAELKIRTVVKKDE